jgi:hypothetical protein
VAFIGGGLVPRWFLENVDTHCALTARGGTPITRTYQLGVSAAPGHDPPVGTQDVSVTPRHSAGQAHTIRRGRPTPFGGAGPHHWKGKRRLRIILVSGLPVLVALPDNA